MRGRLGFIDQCRWHLQNWSDETADRQTLRTMAFACQSRINRIEKVYDVIWDSDPEHFATDVYVKATMLELAVCRVYVAWTQRIVPYKVHQCDHGHEWIYRAFCPVCGSITYRPVRNARPRDWISILGRYSVYPRKR